MAKISDYTILEYLFSNGTETRKIGNEIVCRCPVCKGDNDFKAGHNCQVNIESNTIFCHSGCGTFTRTKLINALDLWDRLDIPPFIPKDEFVKSKKQETAIYTPIINNIENKPEIERLLSIEIPPILWDRDAESFKNINILKNYHNSGNRLIFNVSADGKVIRNGISADGNNIKWKWNGKQPIFNKLTDKKLIFFASGVAEYLILDWLGLDYIVLPSDSLKLKLTGFREQLKNKAIIILPDKDVKGSFDGVIKIIKENAAKIHVCNFYQDHDFRDYCHRIADNFKTKQEFIDALELNIFTELGGSESADCVIEDDIYNLVYETAEPEQAEKEQDYSQYLISNLITNIKPIVDIRVMGLKIQYQSIFGIVGATSAGKTDTLLQLMQEHANIDNHISLYLYYEGLPNEIGIRSEKKKITGNNIYAIPNLLDFKKLEKFIETFKDKKILIATDYYQSLAWNLYLNDQNKKNAAIIRDYTMQIFIAQNKIRQKYENVIFCNTYAINNASITAAGKEQSVHPFNVLNGAKEDGYIQYQVDYAYVMMFSQDKIKWYLSRYDEYGKIREYIKIATAKPNRIGIKSGNPIYIWENGQFILDNDIIEQSKANYNNIATQEQQYATKQEVWG
ncbi:MAG: hypothetical protein ACYCSW_11100 [bacterium]